MEKIYIALYKPFGYLSQFTGELGQKTLAEFDLPSGVYAVGRLDKDSEGLLLLTNDGPFQHRMASPKFNHQKVYWVQVEGEPSENELDKLRTGVIIKGGYRTKQCQAICLSEEPNLPPRNPPIRIRKSIPTTWLALTLTEGKNRQVRRMTAKIGFPTLRLIRVQIEKVTLKDLVPGQWRLLSKKEIG
jgi:23S rRNA pseudouridine2457 synthase